MKKFELVAEISKEFFGKKLFRIRALISFGIVDKGDLGGWVEKEDNLSQGGDAWVFGDARVSGNAQVSGNAWVFGDAWVSGDARVSGNAQVSGNAWVFGDAYWLLVGPVGSENGFLTAFRQKDNSIMVRRGCFEGTIDEFESAVKETHNDNEFAKKYLALIPFIKLQLKEVEVSDEEE